jgi:hypothetical protein
MPQTASKQVRGYLLKIREDFLHDSAFAEILTDQTYLEVKLPTKLENYKYKPFLHFGNLLTFDLVKTRKHWIVTHIEYYEKLNYTGWSYEKFEAIADLNKLLVLSLHLDQECQILDWLREYLRLLRFESGIEIFKKSIYVNNFLNELDIKLGFKAYKT